MTINSKTQKAKRLEQVPAPFLMSFSNVRAAHAAPNAHNQELIARAANGVTAQGQSSDMVVGARNRPAPDNKAKAASNAKPPLIQAGSGCCPLTFAPGKRT